MDAALAPQVQVPLTVDIDGAEVMRAVQKHRNI